MAGTLKRRFQIQKWKSRVKATHGVAFIHTFGAMPSGDELAMLKVLQKQSIVVSIAVHSSFVSYRGGIYRGPKPEECFDVLRSKIFHAMEVIGYERTIDGEICLIAKNL